MKNNFTLSQCSWSSFNTNYHGMQDIIKIKEKILPEEGSKKIVLLPGVYEYPFSFEIPKEIPSSVETDTEVGDGGHINYYVVVRKKFNSIN